MKSNRPVKRPKSKKHAPQKREPMAQLFQKAKEQNNAPPQTKERTFRENARLSRQEREALVQLERQTEFLQHISKDARDERRNLGMIRLYAFFFTLGIPVGLSQTIFSTPENAPVSLFNEAATAASFIAFGLIGQNISNIYEKDMARQTRISQRAEEAHQKLLKNDFRKLKINQEHTYKGFYKQANQDIIDQIEAAKNLKNWKKTSNGQPQITPFKHDNSSKAINAAIMTAILACTINLFVSWTESPYYEKNIEWLQKQFGMESPNGDRNPNPFAVEDQHVKIQEMILTIRHPN